MDKNEVKIKSCTFRGNAPSVSKWRTLLASKGPNRVLLTSRRRTNTPSTPLATSLISRLFGKEDLIQDDNRHHHQTKSPGT